MAPFSRPFGAEPFGGGNSNITDLILRRGDIAAQRALDSGRMWGEAISGIGQAVGGMLAQRQEEKQLAKRDAALMQLLQSDDAPPEAYMRVMGPEGLKVWTARQAAMETRAKLGRESREDAFKRLPVIAQGFDALPEALKPGAYQSLRSTLIEAGLASEEQAPPEYSREAVDPYVKSLLPKKERKTVNAGGRVLEIPEEGPAQVLYEPPPEPVKPKYEQVGNTLLEITPEGPKIAFTAPRETSGPRPLTQTAEAGLIAKLNKDWQTLSKPAAELNRQRNIMHAGLKAAEKGDMASGSQAVLVTFQKILDPTSVVRESEYARSGAGQSLLARAQGAFERLKMGGAGVPLDELKKFAGLADEIVKASTGGYLEAQKKRISATADRYQIPQELIFEEFDFNAQPEAPTGPAIGERKTFSNGKVGVWDGKGWRAQ